jgi:tRNA threonylcarbamoyladenosine biosynthesis protein TsaE
MWRGTLTGAPTVPSRGVPATETASPAETEALAARLAAALRPGDVVLVSGELGAGKTTFVRGAARALGVRGPVTSPTFTLARRYEDGRVPISHLDLFRLAGLDAEEPDLLADELAGDRVAFVEWPEQAGVDLGGVNVAARVRLEHLGGDRRRVIIDP